MPKGGALYFVVACGFSWSLALVLFLLPHPVHPLVRMGLLSLYMLGPALGALAAQRLRRERVAGPLSVKLAPNRFWLVAWLAPPVYAVVCGLVSACFPGVTLAFDFSGLLERLAPGLDGEQLAKATAQLTSLPPPALFAIFLAQALVAGVSVNALFAFGEELGWRGFLFARPLVDGFWGNALATGVVWGLWHAPIILQGHNYPEHPVLGVLWMTAWTTLLSPPFAYLRERGGSVWTAAILHGTLNASAGLAVVFVRGGSDLIVGATGLAGILTLVPLNVAVAAARRSR